MGEYNRTWPSARRLRSKAAARVGVVASGAALALAAAAPNEAAASERWRFFERNGFPVAQSCSFDGPISACATVKCGGNAKVHIALEEISPNASVRGKGQLLASRYVDNVDWRNDRGGAGRSVYANEINIQAALNMLKSRQSMTAIINPRAGERGEIDFTLRGSSRAISRVEDICRAIARGDAPAAPLGRPAPPRAQSAIVETSRWRYTESGRNAFAESCGQFGRREICATVYCRRGQGLEFGLSGLNEDNATARSGRLTLGRSRNVTFTLERGPEGRGDRIWRADHPNPERFADRLKRADLLEVEIERRRRPLFFTLSGSRRAIENVEARCAEVADRRADRRDERVQTARPRQVFARYEEEVVGRWGVDRFSCRGGGWVFDQTALSTPDGAVCDRVQLAELDGGSLDGGLAVRGIECRGGASARIGRTREFEVLRQGNRLIMSTVEERTIRAGNLTIQLGSQANVRELTRCR